MPAADRTPFSSLLARLFRNTEEPENGQACWTWTGKVEKRYPRCNIRLPGVGRTFSIKPHRAVLVLMECRGETEHFLDLYAYYSLAGFEADHLCEDNALCINPDHLQWLTPEAHAAKRQENRNRGQRSQVLGPDHGGAVGAGSEDGPNRERRDERDAGLVPVP